MNKNKQQPWKQKHKKQIAKYRKKYYKIHKEEEKEKTVIWRKKNRERVRITYKNWVKRNKQKLKIMKQNIYKKYKTRRNKKRNERKIKDVNFKILENLRVRLYQVLKGNPKFNTTKKLLGCSILKLKKHLQKRFKKDMSWNNYGKWHVDHIKPCCKFDLSKANEQKKCFHYTNLQPLWASENLRKRMSYEEE